MVESEVEDVAEGSTVGTRVGPAVDWPLGTTVGLREMVDFLLESADERSDDKEAPVTVEPEIE
jgi:hypothetical protein